MVNIYNNLKAEGISYKDYGIALGIFEKSVKCNSNADGGKEQHG